MSKDISFSCMYCSRDSQETDICQKTHSCNRSDKIDRTPSFHEKRLPTRPAPARKEGTLHGGYSLLFTTEVAQKESREGSSVGARSIRSICVPRIPPGHRKKRQKGTAKLFIDLRRTRTCSLPLRRGTPYLLASRPSIIWDTNFKCPLSM